MKKFNNLFNAYSPWIKFDNVDWGKFDINFSLKKYPAKQIIYDRKDESHYVYIIKKGRVRLSTFSRDGREQCLSIAEDGGMFGELSVIDGLENFATATTVIDSYIYVIPKNDFERIYTSDEQLQVLLLQSLVRKIRILSSLVETLSFESSESRVARYLVELVNSHSSNYNNKPLLDIKFTQQEMADLTGLSRVSVSQIMNFFYEKGVIEKLNGYIYINDLNYLKSIL